jgi:hypothetical protein
MTMMGEVQMGKEPTEWRSNGVFGFPVTPSRSSTPFASCLAGLSRQGLPRRRKPSRRRNRPIRSPAKRGVRGYHGCEALIGEIPAIRRSQSAFPPCPTLASQTQSSRVKPGQTQSNPVKPSQTQSNHPPTSAWVAGIPVAPPYIVVSLAKSTTHGGCRHCGQAGTPAIRDSRNLAESNPVKPSQSVFQP